MDDNAVIREAIRAVQRGVSVDANFRVIYDRYRRGVLGYFRAKGVPEEVARELTQETFLGIYRGLEGFRGDSRFATWLFSVAENTFKKWVRANSTNRRKGRTVSMNDECIVESLSSEADDPLAEVMATERRISLEKLIEELPDQMRKCLILSLYQELSLKEISTVMRISVETVKVHLHKARKKLQDAACALDDEGYAERA